MDPGHQEAAAAFDDFSHKLDRASGDRDARRDDRPLRCVVDDLDRDIFFACPHNIYAICIVIEAVVVKIESRSEDWPCSNSP